MGLFNRKKSQKRSVAMIADGNGWNTICSSGYATLAKNPEVITGCQRIADLIASMTIHLMDKKEGGDKRIINELSRKVDITPNQYMTRYTLMNTVVMNMLLYGNGNAVVFPTTDGGRLGDLIPIPPSNVSFTQDGYGYKININGISHNPSELLHFVFNPNPEMPWQGQGIRVAAKNVVENLAQASATEKAFLESKYQPSLIIKVDGLTEEFASPEGRSTLLKDYIGTAERGEPWMIPSEQFSVEQIRPLSLNDIALNDSIKLNKQTVASILGVPAFLLGAGEYNDKEWNNFISSKIRPLAKSIEQEMTRKLLLSPNWFFKFNVASLYSYDLQTTASVYSDLYIKGIVDGNEVRDKLSLSPREGLGELVILENYIPLDKVGEQNKLKKE